MTASFEPWFNFLVCVLLVIGTTFPSHAGNAQDIGFFGDTSKASLDFFYQQSEYPRDCVEALGQCTSANSTGVYTIKPDGYSEVFDVYCDRDGYTVIERRLDGLISFNRSWEDYTSGFGFLSQEFWLGTHKLSYMTNQKTYLLHIEFTLHDGSTIYATYDTFRIADAYSDYKLVSTGDFSDDGEWNLWGPCSVTCGEGVSRRYSRCTEGAVCVERNVEETVCTEEECPIDGGWSDWSDWTGCPVTCGGGHKFRERLCNNPVPQHGSRDCLGNAQQNLSCATILCPVDGSWSSWSAWSGCTVSCGGGLQLRDRDCNNPVPQHGGRECIGYPQHNQRCNTGSCRVLDCQDIYDSGQTSSGRYYINPSGSAPFQVYCNMSHGGGWTVFQRRIDGGVDFFLNWASYSAGFGDLGGEHWLGNDKIHYLTYQKRYKLRIDMLDKDNRPRYGEFDFFRIENEDALYRLSRVGAYRGNAVAGYCGSSNGRFLLEYYRNPPFSTKDRDNDAAGDRNLAADLKSAWWYKDNSYHVCCGRPGVYHTLNGAYPDSIYGYCLHPDGKIRYSEMKIRPV